ncbi:DUF4262 domain-containing protein, partial [Frankia canadensis]|uniref:DUF4262 domain-containing protein n=1 Tax=Frankia canadensis TaxID=1836972 RepID=UPI000E1F6087
MDLQTWTDQDNAWIRRTIARRGWAIRAVLAEPTHDEPDYAYTIGLTALHHPELMIAGLPPTHAATLLNHLGDRIRAGDPPPPQRHYLLTLPPHASDELLLDANSTYQLCVAHVLRTTTPTPLPA